jgi:hypothetical protein
MNFILNSIESASQQGQYLPALITALTIPDIAGAIESPGAGSRSRYVKWVDDWFSPMFPAYLLHDIDGLAIYALRCKLLHEGLTDPSQAPAARRSAASQKRLIAFNIGQGVVMHLLTSEDTAGDSWTVLRAEIFCAEIVDAARSWLKARENDPSAMQALNALVDVRMDVPPLSRGVPLICAAI